MSDKDFWLIIEECDWKKDFNYDRIRQKLEAEYNKDIRNQLIDFISARRKELYARLEQFGRTKVKGDYEHRGICWVGCSDDGLSDLVNHIIGLGENEFNKVMKNPMAAKTRAGAGKYKESFAYCLHFED